MAERIFVTDAQVKAAQLIVRHNRALRRDSDPATLRIAALGRPEETGPSAPPPVTSGGAVRRRGVLPAIRRRLGLEHALDRPAPPPRAGAVRPDTSFWYALSPAERNALRAEGALRTFRPGDKLMHEGERGDHVIVILGGRAKISVNRDGRDRTLAIRGPGQLIGERAAREESVRSATVTAFEMIWALVLQTKDFAAFLGAHPRAAGLMQDQIYDWLTEEPPEFKDDEAAETPGADLAADYSRQRLELMNGENFTVLHFDVVGFGSRADTDRALIRGALAGMTAPVLQDISGAWTDDRGDGLLMVLPPTVSTAEIMDRLVKELPAAVDRHNGSQPDSARIQLRLAINVGPVLSGATDVSGEAVAIAAQMLDTRQFKEAVVSSQTSLGVIISPFVFETVVRTGSDLTEETSYTPVPVEIKQSSTTAWMKLISRDLAAR